MRKFLTTALRSLGLGKFGPNREKLEKQLLESVFEVIGGLGERAGDAQDPEPILIHVLGNVMFRLVFGHVWEKGDSTWKTLQFLQEEGTKFIGVAGAINFLPFLRFLPRYRKAIEFIENGILFTHEIYQGFLGKCVGKGDCLMGAYFGEMGRGGFFNKVQFNYLMADVFGAGVDTTLATLRWFLLFMGLNPDWQVGEILFTRILLNFS